MHSSLIASCQNSNYDFRARWPNQHPFESFPRGVCWRFHSGQFCRGCNFKHSCFKYGAAQPASQCSANRANSNPSNAAASMPSGSDSQGQTSVAEPRANASKARSSLAFYLKGYNNVISDYLIQGFLYGFSIRYFGSLLAIRSPNLRSAMDNPTSINDKLSKELAAGRIVGLYSKPDLPPFETFRVSPLRIVTKTLPGEFRLIHHLS